MKSLITTLLAVGIISPAAAYAFSIEEMIEAAKAGNGTYVESHSSVSTGGQTAKSGETITTGDSSASSHVETRIEAGSNGGKVEVKIESSKNGNVKTEEYSTPIEKDEGVTVKANATMEKGEYSSEVEVDGEKVEPVQANVEQAAAASVTMQSRISLLFTTKIPSMFKRMVSFLWWF